ncbi:MAG: segregation/condensation protein A [Saprospiraceae bacterium]
MDTSYTIKIDKFEGPFDLLLFFIERDDLDIYDIPIAKITADFLAYIRDLELLNIDVASEFILVAATLMKIKAKMLIPRKEVNEAGEEIDPREELVQRLIEYRKYKAATEDLSILEENRHLKHERGNIQTELKALGEKALIDIELESLSLFKLLNTYLALMQKNELEKSKPKHQIINYSYSITGQQTYIFDTLKTTGKVRFEELFLKLSNRIEAIVTFIALLELLNLQSLTLLQGEGINDFWISSKSEN